MIGPVVFEVYCYAPPELGVFPCKRNGMTEFCLRGGKCPFVSAVPVSLIYIAKRDVSIVSLIKEKVRYWVDQVYHIIKWKLIPRSAIDDLEEIDEQLDKSPEFLTWATVQDIENFEFYRWLDRVLAAEYELREDAIEGTSDDVETTVADEKV